VDELNQHLTNHFSALRDARSGPVFFLEHGLPADEREHLFGEVRDACQHYQLDAGWWRVRPLPLLVAATEVGYCYQGCGTDFWPILGEELRHNITAPERQALQELFREAAHTFRGATPKSTPWAEAFHLIAWPIVHAIMPIEFHRRFATLLADLRIEVADLDDDRLYRAIMFVAGHRSARFSSFLEDSQTVVSVARHLLQGQSAALSQDVLTRLGSDIAGDGSAKRELLAARGIQRSLRQKPSPTATREADTINGYFQIRVHGGDLLLEAGFPSADIRVVESLRRAVRRLRYAPRLWGVTARISAEQLLSTVPFVVRFTEPPELDAELLPGLESLEIAPELLSELKRYSLDLAPPLVFSVLNDPEHQVAQQVHGVEISARRNYWVLIESTADVALQALKKIGSVGPFECRLADPATADGRRALEAMGYRLVTGAAVAFAGVPPINGEAPIPEFVVGDTRVLFQRRAHQQGLKVRLGDEEILLDSEAVRITIPRGESVLRVTSENQERKYRFRGVETASPSAAGLIGFSLTTSEGTIQALQAGAIGLRVESLVPFDGLNLVLELTIRDYRASVCMPLGTLPRVLQPGDPIWNELLDETARRLLTRSANCELRARIGNLASAVWELEQRIRPAWWTMGANGPVLMSETGELQLAAIAPSDPATLPQDMELINDEVKLLTPADVSLDPENEFLTFCVGSPKLLGKLQISKPGFARQRTQRGDSRGLEDLMSAYLKWGLAQTANLGAEICRRQVARELESWVVEVCCGADWKTAEERLSADSSWQSLLNRCVTDGLGIDPYVELLPGDVDDICYEGIAEARRVLPELLVRAESFGVDDRGVLNAAFGRAYEIVADRHDRKGRHERAAQMRAGDPSTSIDDWRCALAEIKEEAMLLPVAALLLPTTEAPSLITIEASLMTFDELHAEFKSWISRARPALSGPAPSDDTLECILHVWMSPGRAVEMDWRSALDTLLSERCISRAARYLSLRARQRF